MVSNLSILDVCGGPGYVSGADSSTELINVEIFFSQ